MHSLIFFGSDQYSQTVLTHLQKHSDLAITHRTDLTTLPPLTPDTIGLSASFPYLFPPEIIERFAGRLYNLHPSLLPQYRNVAPVPYAIALGDQVTGITLFQIGQGIDDGEIVAQVKEPILSSDTTPVLLHRLFALGTKLFLDFLNQASPSPKSNISRLTSNLIFTHRLTSQFGFIEWPVFQKLLTHQPILPNDATNPLLKLRLQHNPHGEILHDLVRALNGYEKVWTIAPTRKGELRLTIESVLPNLTIKLAGKPKPISYNDFVKYYLE